MRRDAMHPSPEQTGMQNTRGCIQGQCCTSLYMHRLARLSAQWSRSPPSRSVGYVRGTRAGPPPRLGFSKTGRGMQLAAALGTARRRRHALLAVDGAASQRRDPHLRGALVTGSRLRHAKARLHCKGGRGCRHPWTTSSTISAAMGVTHCSTLVQPPVRARLR